MKKTLSLLLALVMLMSVLIIPAAAAMPEEDVAEPFAWMDCPRCHDSARIYSSTPVYREMHNVTSCSKYNAAHTHYRSGTRYVLECPNCGAFQYFKVTSETCG